MGEWIIPQELDDYYVIIDDRVSITIPQDAEIGTTYDITYVRDSNCKKTKTITVVGCNPEDDETLDAYLRNFSPLVTAELPETVMIEYTGDTKCTYNYIKHVYDYVKKETEDDIVMAWVIANVLSEITPDAFKVGRYFYMAASYGGIPEPNQSSVDIYNKRKLGSVYYAKYKHSDYDDSITMVQASRNELHNLGVTVAVENTTPLADLSGSNDTPKGIGSDGNSVYLPLPPGQRVGKDERVLRTDSYDYDKMEEYLLWDNAKKLKDKYSNCDYRPIKDKKAKSEYYCERIGITQETDKWQTYFDNCQIMQKLESDWNKTHAYRFRPGACKLGSNTGVQIPYICKSTTDDSGCLNQPLDNDCDYEVENYTNPDTRPNAKMSYPSGHASWSYFLSLLYLEATGIDTTDIAEQFGLSRNLVKAHFVTDVLIGQVACTACIGYLNGFKEFNARYNLVRNIEH